MTNVLVTLLYELVLKFSFEFMSCWSINPSSISVKIGIFEVVVDEEFFLEGEPFCWFSIFGINEEVVLVGVTNKIPSSFEEFSVLDLA